MGFAVPLVFQAKRNFGIVLRPSSEGISIAFTRLAKLGMLVEISIAAITAALFIGKRAVADAQRKKPRDQSKLETRKFPICPLKSSVPPADHRRPAHGLARIPASTADGPGAILPRVGLSAKSAAPEGAGPKIPPT